MARVAAVGPAHGREEAGTTNRETVEALVTKERPGWRVVDFIEVNDESGPSFEVTVENGGRQTTLLVGEGKRIVGERR
jgi:hypothetical protein